MEGAGEGMVAIVQGLQNAGLAVTLVDGRCCDLDRKKISAKIFAKPLNAVPMSKSSVETSTRCVNRINNSAQICDDRYASSYQLAHCSIRPSSPPVHLPEFPPQRSSPCRAQGNFKVNGYGSGEASFVSMKPMESCKRSFDWPVRVSKGYSKSMRSLLKEKSFSKDEKLHKKSSKNMQTYTRTKPRVMKEIGPNINNDIRVSFEDNLKPNDRKSNNISKDNQLGETYDYLKAQHTPRRRGAGRSTEVRYLNDLTRCIRDTIRQIYDDKAVVCPTIKSRYSRHKREHHKNCNKISTCQQTCPTRPQLCYYCHEPKPCACRPSTSTTIPLVEASKPSEDNCRCNEKYQEDKDGIESLVFEWLKEIPVYVNERSEEKAKREEMVKKLANTLKNIAENENYDDKAKEEIKKCLTDLPMWCPGAKREQELFRDQITYNLLDKLKHSSKNNAWNRSRTMDNIFDDNNSTQNYENKTSDPLSPRSVFQNDLKQTMREEVSDVLRMYKVTNKEVQENIANLLADQVIRGGDDRNTMDQVCSILQNTIVSEKQAEEICNKLIGVTKEMSLGYKSQDSVIGFSKSRLRQSFSPMHREAFSENAERVILDFIEEITGDDTPHIGIRWKAATEHVVQRLGEIMFDPDHTEKTDMIRSEVTKYLRKLSIDADVSRDDLAIELTSRIQNIAFQTSTPRKGLKGRNFSFHPKRNDTGSISSIYFDDDITRTTTETKKSPESKISYEEQNYAKELTDAINIWIKELPIDLNASVDKGFKNTMVKDLVGDIIDRQKYLQLNPHAKNSEKEELEHLNYQVFRWLNKLLDINDMTPILYKTELLMNQLKNVKVPQLVNAPGKNQNAKSDKVEMANVLDALENEISTWIEEIPHNLYQSTDSSFLRRTIRELAENIQQLKNNNQEAELDNQISKWISKVVKDSDRKYAEALKFRLQNKGFVGASQVISQDSSQFIEENLTGGIMDWFTNLPLYQKRTLEEKRLIENVIPKLAKSLKKVIEAVSNSADVNTDDLLINEIVKHLKELPMDKGQKSDKEFLKRTAIQLLHYLKGLQMFQNISDRCDRPPDEYLTANIEDWINSLPINCKMNPSEMKLFNKLKVDFIKNLKKVQYQNDQALKDEIKMFLHSLPLDEAVKKDENFVNEKVQQLLKNLQVVPVNGEERRSLGAIKNGMDIWSKPLPSQSEQSQRKESKFVGNRSTSINDTDFYTKAVDVLFDSIERWCEELPINLGPSEHESVLKQKLAKRLIHKIGEMNMDPQIFNDDFLYEDLLQDEIDSLLNCLHSNDELMSRLTSLKSILMDVVKESRKKIQCEVAGKAYIHQLRETISKTVKRLGNVHAEERANFEVLKDNVADKFINLYYIGDEEELNIYKKKISDEINKFCNDYLKRHPATPVDSRKLNQDLYNALRNIPPPNGESLRGEVELVKLKEEINKWVKTLPLKEQTESEQLRANKIIFVLAKALRDIENEKKNHLSIDSDHIMRKEIERWMKKLPLRSGDYDVSQLADQLISNLKNTEDSRRMSSSKRHSIDPDFNWENSKYHIDQSQLTYSNTDMSQDACPIPPSTLSTEDKAHLQRIREKSSLTPRFRIPRTCIDACASHLPVDVYSQTDVNPSGVPACPAIQSSSSQTQPCPHQQRTYGRIQGIGSQVEIPPQVIVKEYFWDSTVNSRLQESMSQPCPPSFQNLVPGQSYATFDPSSAQHSFVQQPSSYSCGHTQPTLAPSPCSQCPHSYIAPQPSIPKGPCLSVLDIPQGNICKRPGMRKAWESNKQPCHGQQMPGPSHEEDPEAGKTESFRASNGRARVTHLGSFDDCQDPRCKRPRRTEKTEDDNYSWSSMRFPENDSEFWGGPRPVITSDEDMEEPYTRDREKREEKVRCRCSERVLTKFRRRPRGCKIPSCQSTHNTSVKHCSKCCGIHCPYPSHLYFRE